MRRNCFFPAYPLKIVTGSVMASVDRESIHSRGIPGSTLMENAGSGVADDLLAKFKKEQLQGAVIFCGKGNNGGDGFVIARHLCREGLSPVVVLIGTGSCLKNEALEHFHKAKNAGVCIHEVEDEETLESLLGRTKANLYIDALLGTGAAGEPKGLIGRSVEFLNGKFNKDIIVSVDIPTGVDSDTGVAAQNTVMADVVYTFGLPKIGHVLPPGLNYYKELKILDIGFPIDLLEKAESVAELLSAGLINEWFPRRRISEHKGSMGHLQIIAGSRTMTGAALMCAKASILTGSGLVTSVCPESMLPVYAQGVWEKLLLPVDETEDGTISETAFEQISPGDRNYTAIVIGPGLSRNESTQRFIQRVIAEKKVPVLIDGDGLFAVSREILMARNEPWVVTPHPGEMARFFNVTVDDIQMDRIGFARRLTEGTNGTCVLKGPKTVICCKGETHYINPTGNPAMASGGMGDVLAGIIGAYLAQGIEPLKAACIGAFVHGLAADLIVEATGAEAVSATQVINSIQKAVHCIRHGNRL